MSCPGRPSQIPSKVLALFHRETEENEELSWCDIIKHNEVYKPYSRLAFKNRFNYLKVTKATAPKRYWKIYADACATLEKNTIMEDNPYIPTKPVPNPVPSGIWATPPRTSTRLAGRAPATANTTRVPPPAAPAAASFSLSLLLLF